MALFACIRDDKKNTTSVEENSVTPLINYGVVKTYPHDTTSFTEGLLIYQGKLYESTGSPQDLLQTRSLIGEVDLTTGTISKQIELDRSKYFGEGIVFLNQKLYQLTYTTQVGFIYDAHTFRQLGSFPIASREGWGLTTDGTHLIMSDGTQKISFLDTTSYKAVKTLLVYDYKGALLKLNELELIKGYLYANIYTTNTIVKIDTTTGQVVGKLDLTSLAADAKSRYPKAMEMNGIAYDSTTHHLYITGKLWPTIYQLQVGI